MGFGTRAAMVALLGLAMAAGCGGDGDDGEEGPGTLAVQGLPATAPCGQALALAVLAADAEGRPRAGVEVQATVQRGGGTLPAVAATTGSDGIATFQWTVGAAPVLQRVALSAGEATATATLEGTLATPWQPRPFGDVDGYLSSQGIDGSTEDLAFAPGGTRLVMGVPGGLVEVDAQGQASTRALSGDAMGWALGLACDADGVLWAADANGKALRRVDAAGKVTSIAGGEGQVQLAYPNDLAVAPGGFVVLADSCLGKVLVFRKDGTLVSEKAFDKATEGGANGVAVDPSGNALWVTTENTSLLCGDGTDPLAANGGLYRFDLGADGALGARTDVAPGMAHYADGATFDAEGNLYVMADVLDTENLSLAESTVWVRPAEGGDLRRFLTATERVLANAAFGTGAFGANTMYLSLVAIPLVVDPSMRGVMAFDVGIAGLPLCE